MEKGLFAERLAQASEQCLDFTRSLVTDMLPEECIYNIFIAKNQTKPIIGDAEVFPQDLLPDGQYVGPFDANGVVEYLWRNGKVPEWININVDMVENGRTVFVLMCCSHFMSLPANHYHRLLEPSGKGAPFHVHGPFAPKGWKPGDGMFTLAEAPHYY